MQHPGGCQFTTDNVHCVSPPVAKVSAAKTGGAFEQFGNGRAKPRLETSQRDVAGKSFRLLGWREGLHRLVHLPVQFAQMAARVLHASPDDARLLRAGKKSDAVCGQLHRRETVANLGHSLFQRLHLRGRHVAEKFQCDMKLLRWRPADGTRRRVPPQLALGAGDFRSHVWRDSERDEQPQER